ncbi:MULTISPECIES: hypothetical protein [Haloferax]|uniref:Uncharacterized protein n=2 Tax=Haloferax TaxID=2251 RepID=A0A6G1Z2R6_9EURY|nr:MULTISPECIES: hypothetical protein [Haloferax]KAB1188102.1 hypothetical protein Hfx1149_08655 [Haloferax sp. CBA1149]MRW80775.1 hypothetical protein [Haloferax marinisediminis]
MADFTLFEVHLHDGFEFSPSNRAPLFNKSERADDDYEAELEEAHEDEYEVEIEADEDDAESGGSRAMSMLFGLVLLVGIAAIVRYIRGRGDDDLDELVDLDDREEVEIGA